MKGPAYTLARNSSIAGRVRAARILVVRSGQNVYDKVVREDSPWDCALLGEAAISDAFNQYTALYGKLIMQLFRDETFKSAIAP